MPTTTWDPGAKSAGVTLSGGNLIATITASSSNVAANRALTGKSYGEYTATTLPSTMSVGIVNRGFVFSSGTLLGANNNGLGYRNSGAVILNGVTLSTISAYVAGNVIRWAINPMLMLAWFAVGAGNWNNNVSANPATDTLGIDYSTIAGSTFLPAGGATFTTNHVLTAAFSSGGWAFSAPSGFSSVDTTGAVGVSNELPSYAAGRSDPLATAYQFCGSPGPVGWGNAGDTDITGVLTEAGVPVAKRVRVYDQNTGQFLGTALSNAGTGVYSIPAFGRSKVFVVAFDDPTYQALVFDDVVPV